MESLQTSLTVIFVAFFFFFSVFIHEFGHCIAAIWRGLHVDKFSVGFGHRIMAKKIKGIDCIVGWIPLGGYVALPQMELGKTAFAADGSELPPIKQKDKIIVALAGPAFNLAFALLLSLIVWGVGENQSPAVESLVVEQVDKKGPEYQAGLRAGDKIVSINDFDAHYSQRVMEAYAYSSDVTIEVLRDGEAKKIGPLKPAMDPDLENLFQPRFDFFAPLPAAIKVEKEMPEKPELGKKSPKIPTPAYAAGLRSGDVIVAINGVKMNYYKDILAFMKTVKAPLVKVDVLRQDEQKSFSFNAIAKKDYDLGLYFAEFPRVAKALFKKPAALSGIKKGDVLLAVDGVEMKSTEEFVKHLKAHIKKGAMSFKFKRGEKELTVSLQAESTRYVLGVVNQQDFVHRSPVDQFSRVIDSTARMIGAMVDPGSSVGPSKMSSVVGIADILYKVASMSFIKALFMVVMINISLAIFNLLPIPVLDGGHITVALMEIITGKTVPLAIFQKIYTVFALLLMSFMAYAVFNDVKRMQRDDIRVERFLPEFNGGLSSSGDRHQV